MSKLDPTVALQVLCRGGLKGDRKVDPKQVDRRIEQLRAQMKADQAERTQPAAPVGPSPRTTRVP